MAVLVLLYGLIHYCTINGFRSEIVASYGENYPEMSEEDREGNATSITITVTFFVTLMVIAAGCLIFAILKVSFQVFFIAFKTLN